MSTVIGIDRPCQGGIARAVKTCVVEGCDTLINTRARANVCEVHKHTPQCNCRGCRGRVHEITIKEPHSRVTLVRAPWEEGGV